MIRLASSAFVLALLLAQLPVAAQSTTAPSTPSQSTASITDTDVQRLRQALADATFRS